MPANPLDALVDAALARYHPDYRGTGRLLCLSENATYRIDTPTARYVMRVHRPGYHSRAAIASELTWLNALRADGLEVPQAIAALDGECIQEVAGFTSEPRQVVLFHWIEGSEPDPQQDLNGSFARLGAINARLHRQARQWVRPTGFTRLSWDHASMLGAAAHWGPWQAAPYLDRQGIALIEQSIQALAPAIASYAEDATRFGLIHADLRLSNLLLDGEHTRIIDFDDCGFGWYMHDLAAALSFFEHHPEAEQWIRHWLDGYSRVASLSSADLHVLPSLILQRRLQLLAWVGSHQGTAQADGLGQPWVAQTLELCRRYLEGRPVGAT